MVESSTVLAFVAVASLAYAAPGPDWFVVMRHAATSRRHGWVAALGVQSGLVVHMCAAAVGVAAVLLASAEAFVVLKLAGATYLVVLGLRALRDSFAATAQPEEVAGTARGALGVWRQSFVANLLNPKAALFFVAVLPQFLSAAAPVAPQVLVLGVIDIALGLVWWALFVLGVRALRTLTDAGRSRAIVDRVSGVALIGLGGFLVTAGRSE